MPTKRRLSILPTLAVIILTLKVAAAQQLIISPAAVTVFENATQDFTVALSAEPTGDVTVTIVSTESMSVRSTPSELVFTTDNWRQSQTVTVAALDDSDIIDNTGSLILIASGGGYNVGGVRLNKSSATLESLGETVHLTATIHDQNDQPVPDVDLSWSSEDTSIAKVDSDGKVTSAGFGVTTVTASFATAQRSATVIVDDPNNSFLTDRWILEDLYKSTGGEDWPWQCNWMTDAPLGDWCGVWTDDNGRVTYIVIGGNNLTGNIPVTLGWMEMLEVLWLSTNNLSGPIPSEISRLENLRVLRLYANALEGTIPPELGGMPNLVELSLTTNKLSGTIPPELSKTDSLKWINLGWNSLTGPIPLELTNLPNLEGLDLYSNKLTGPIPPELGLMSSLRWLRLTENFFSGPIPPELANLQKLEWLSLARSGVSGIIPPELGNLKNLTVLRLNENKLSGPIPPELGKLENLEHFILSYNSLTGTIPKEIGNLRSLTDISVHGNESLHGLIPRSFIGIGLADFSFGGTKLCPHQDAVFLKWWGSIAYTSRVNNYCTPSRVERLALLELYDQTNGDEWMNSDGWDSNSDVAGWYGVTSAMGRVRSVTLEGNGLNGPIPGAIANLTGLRILNLSDNSLDGSLPEEVAFLSDLTELRVNGNPDLEGALSYNLQNLDGLQVLHFSGTSLCASPAPTFQTWYNNIPSAVGTICGNPDEVLLDIPAAYLVQSVQTQDGLVRLIEGRDALLRVFLTAIPAPAYYEPRVVATVQSGGRTRRVEMRRAGDRLTMGVDESDLSNSFNATIPGEFITSDATLVIEADPDGIIPRAAGSSDRFPTTGEERLNVVSVPPMEVTVVPVMEVDEPDRSILPWTNTISDDSPEVGLFKYSFPFGEFRAESREEYFTSLDLTRSNDQWSLVLELEALRLLDNATGYYYGAGASVNGYVRGRARLGGKASMGKAWDTELAHEIGHNLNLPHAPCGGALNTDQDFPHEGGGVGSWGINQRDGSLISPHYHKDIMGYCYELGWLSDYNYDLTIDYRQAHEGGRPVAGTVQKTDLLVLWGGVQGGELRINPPFQATVPAQLPESDGPYRLEGFGLNGELFSISFTPDEDKFGDKYFLFAIPVEQAWESALERIVLTGPEGILTMDTNEQSTLTFIRDANTGRVRSILRDWDGNMPAALEEIGDLNIVTTQGIPETIRLQR